VSGHIWLAVVAVLMSLVGAYYYLRVVKVMYFDPQGWEFYATTASLFLTFAFPGFVYRYLARRRG
jgi:NADH:ubiquinone oxidoreductase subunit 2 (subunit N)